MVKKIRAGFYSSGIANFSPIGPYYLISYRILRDQFEHSSIHEGFLSTNGLNGIGLDTPKLTYSGRRCLLATDKRTDLRIR